MVRGAPLVVVSGKAGEVTNNNKFSTEQFQSNIKCSNMSLLVAKSLKKQLKVFPSASP